MYRKIYKEIIDIALPSILTNITVPLLGLVDMMIVGHLGAASYIGAIAVGCTIFNIIYWIFAFFRMGTSGMTSQAYGARNLNEAYVTLFRSLIGAVGFSLLLIILRLPLLEIALLIMQPSIEVAHYATVYFNICIWGAPAVLAMYSISGWLIGMQNAKYPLYIAVAQNIINIITSTYFVFVLKLSVLGVAWGTVIAQYVGLIMSVLFCIRMYVKDKCKVHIVVCNVFNKDPLRRFIMVNKDIFLRTLCIVSVTLFFTSAGARQGDYILAANAILMQFFTFYSYFMDGFAFSSEALVGKTQGAKSYFQQSVVIKLLFICGCVVAALFTLIYLLGGTSIIFILTNEIAVREFAKDYLTWVVCIPFAGLSAFIWDGVFIGITATKEMLKSMFLALLAFFVVYLLLNEALGNHALWLAFIIYLMVRGISQHCLYKNKIIPLRSEHK